MFYKKYVQGISKSGALMVHIFFSFFFLALKCAFDKPGKQQLK